ncbi:MAG: DNA replication/repair protein RecF [Actinobacteria bacterium]|nr:DNA replication/repair protein RecF [Actinomycetota bacterium]
MQLAAIELNGFRCWSALSLEFPSGRVAIVGANASGKTSIVEAAWYAATLSSHRAPDAALVMRGRDSAVVRATALRDARTQVVELEIRTQGASRAQLGGAPVRRKREILGTLRASLFAPERLAVVRGDPLERRRFLDEMLVQLSPRLYATMRDYDKTLRQRNALLKEAGGRVPPGLDAWDASLAGPGGEIAAARAETIALLAPHAAAAWSAIAGTGDLRIAFTPNVPDQGAAASSEDWTKAMLARLQERRPDELVRGVTLVGPHRDDVALEIDGLPARNHASQGEAWLLALALVVGAHRLIADRTGDEPVLLLDDALEPLDPDRRERVGTALPDAQTIVTAADPGAIPDSLGARIYRVSGGMVIA